MTILTFLLAMGFLFMIFTAGSKKTRELQEERRRIHRRIVDSRDKGQENDFEHDCSLTREILEAAKKAGVERRPERVVVRIVEHHEGEYSAVVPAWRGKEAVGIPESAIPQALGKICPGDHLLADVNINAPSSDPLYFANFDRAPEPAELD